QAVVVSVDILTHLRRDIALEQKIAVGAEDGIDFTLIRPHARKDVSRQTAKPPGAGLQHGRTDSRRSDMLTDLKRAVELLDDQHPVAADALAGEIKDAVNLSNAIADAALTDGDEVGAVGQGRV